MTEIAVIGVTAFVACGLTFFSGFGLGTLLMPAFAFFFPIELAVAMTAIVHLLNNVFKLVLLGKFADWKTVGSFGIPAVVCAVLGAFALTVMDGAGLKRVMGLVIIGFALFELLPQCQALAFDRKYLPLGGALSGFFGGLSGHQGALRSAFLVKSGLTKEQFLGTGVIIACLVDATRLVVYGRHMTMTGIDENRGLLMVALVCAAAGTVLGSRFLKKITMKGIHTVVGVLLLTIGILLGLGMI